mgnify:CR=1 FL=1
MRQLADWAGSRLRDREDSEHGQATVRLVIATLILLYLWWLQPAVGRTMGMLQVLRVEQSLPSMPLYAGNGQGRFQSPCSRRQPQAGQENLR